MRLSFGHSTNSEQIVVHGHCVMPIQGEWKELIWRERELVISFPPREANPVVHSLHFPNFETHICFLFKAFEISEHQ